MRINLLLELALDARSVRFRTLDRGKYVFERQLKTPLGKAITILLAIGRRVNNGLRKLDIAVTRILDRWTAYGVEPIVALFTNGRSIAKDI